MELVTRAIKGTKDVLPSESYKNQYIEGVAMAVAECFGYSEIRTPVFEHTELFNRSVGDTTDVVQKEMYTFDDKGGRSITLRPEGTAGAVRSFLENGLFNEPLPQKMSYLTSCYRYEKPQSGRYREFHQFGVECIGAGEAAADAEIISLAVQFFDMLGLEKLSLEINSIGCPECRKSYTAALREYFEAHKSELCETCLSRLERNPMRILDCKSPVCSAISAGAPVVLDYICDDCRAHFESLKSYLEALEIDYTVNPHIVRGLDYYTRTVFEIVSGNENTKGLVCGGGGRYDGLVEELGGSPLPACGFGIGLERVKIIMESEGVPFPEKNRTDLFLASMGAQANVLAAKIVSELRFEGFRADFELCGRSVKSQMKFAGKTNARYTAVIGDGEIESGEIALKNMDDGTTQTVSLADFTEHFSDIIIQGTLSSIAETNIEDFDIKV
ncbi:MAG: histidine--tRNA ligase [Clostridiales bacterium]|nr:histidine--tRNA ligase [Clostridiales bacterium]